VVVVADAAAPTTTAVLRLDLPFREQTASLGAVARRKVAIAGRAMDEMEKRWVRLIQMKIEEIQTLERRKYYRAQADADRAARKAGAPEPKSWPFDKSKFFFVPSSWMSLCGKDALIMRVLDEIRADAKSKKEELPWPECLPSGIFLNDSLRAYVDAFRAEVDAGGAVVIDVVGE
jgi:hypothetical protein